MYHNSFYKPVRAGTMVRYRVCCIIPFEEAATVDHATRKDQGVKV